MSLEQNKATLVRFLDEAFNCGNLAIVGELTTADITYHTLAELSAAMRESGSSSPECARRSRIWRSPSRM